MNIKQIDELAKGIDAALDRNDIDSIKIFLIQLEELSQNDLTKIELSKVSFFKANCYSGIRNCQSIEDLWNWNNSSLEKEIYQLRVARSLLLDIPFGEDKTDLRFRVTTNLASALNYIGRFIEAIDLWDEVLEYAPKFAMSVANRAYALSYYGKHLYDLSHKIIFLNESYHQTKLALKFGVEKHAQIDVQNWLKFLLTMHNWENVQFQPQKESRGRSKYERLYRTWCLEHKLFLNPLNDLWKDDIAANDIFTLPSIITGIEDVSYGSPPEVYGIYNQLKQEYISARYMLFEAINESQMEIHFSDKKVLLYDMLDYRKYRLWIEKIKMAFLSIFSIFDKMAYLINDYWKLNLSARNIGFKSCWLKNQQLAPIFQQSKNLPLRGLYWISREFVGIEEESALQPEAWHIAKIRNHIAHKYLKVFDGFVDIEKLRKSKNQDWEYPINDKELLNQTLKLLSLTRSALMYISMAIYVEEQNKKNELGDGIVGELELYQINNAQRL
jgi:hypothetical protein